MINSKNTMEKYLPINEEQTKCFVNELNNGMPGLYMRLGKGEVGVESTKTSASLNVGVSPPTEIQRKNFAKLYKEALWNTDILFIWNEGWFGREESYIKKYGRRDVKKLPINILDFQVWIAFKHKNTWLRALDDKRVLLVSPFSETIKFQASRIEEIFGPEHGLPKFKELLYITAPLSHALPEEKVEKTWSQNLEDLEKQLESMKDNFDIAIFCCGGYGAPLAFKTKKLGKKGIVLGSTLYMMFGIRFKRAEESELFRSLMNSNWIRPIEPKPACYEKIEGGCYW